MKKIGIILLSSAFFVLVVVSVSSNQKSQRVSQRTVDRMATRVNPPSPESLPSAPAAATSLEAGQQAASPQTGEEPPLLNPPHGEPFHICEIPVGAPLPRPTPAENATAAAAPVAAAQQSPRLNPPHGQPGHICEIPVGAPLPD